MITPMDYLRSEAKRLPNGTAAKVLSALTLAAIDSGIRNSGSDAAPNHHDRTDAVTITISRADAEDLYEQRFGCGCGESGFSNAVENAIRAALEGKR